ncbi:MAG: hypothetical protein H6685_14165 [Deltaproteobacteria bacterium]|nr:hypothetical protein [Deltaproteobacteria bacterium]
MAPGCKIRHADRTRRRRAWPAVIPALVVVWALLAAVAFAQDIGGVEIETSISNSLITVGDPIDYTITVRWDSSVVKGAPAISENLGSLVIQDQTLDQTVEVDATHRERKQTFRVTSYKVGDYQIPPPTIRYVDTAGQNLTARGEPVSLTVKSIAPEDAADIRDIKPPRDVPRNITPIILMFLGAVVLLTALFYGIYRWRKGRGPKDLPSPPEPAHVTALRLLAGLDRYSLDDHESIKAFYVELSSILRDYLWGRFSLDAPRLTTRQLKIALEDAGPKGRVGLLETLTRHQIFAVLDTGDLVKFAKVDPMREEIDEDRRRVRRFVEATKPLDVPTPEQPAVADSDNREGAA